MLTKLAVIWWIWTVMSRENNLRQMWEKWMKQRICTFVLPCIGFLSWCCSIPRNKGTYGEVGREEGNGPKISTIEDFFFCMCQIEKLSLSQFQCLCTLYHRYRWAMGRRTWKIYVTYLKCVKFWSCCHEIKLYMPGSFLLLFSLYATVDREWVSRNEDV